MSDKVNCNKVEHRTKIKKMEEMVNNTLENVYDTEFALDHAVTASQVESIKDKNERRCASVVDARREIEEERSYL